MSKCKIVLSGSDNAFVAKLAQLIHNAFTSGDSPIAALEAESWQPGVVTMTAEAWTEAKPLSFTHAEFSDALRPAERERGAEVWSIQTMARFVLVEGIQHRAGLKMKKRGTYLADQFAEMGEGYEAHRQLAALVGAGIVTGEGVKGLARTVLATVDATCCDGDQVVFDTEVNYRAIPLHIEPLPAQLGCIHSAEAIALAGLVIQLVGDHPESRAYRLADKIVKEATGVTRG